MGRGEGRLLAYHGPAEEFAIFARLAFYVKPDHDWLPGGRIAAATFGGTRMGTPQAAHFMKSTKP
jgi:hypothetical protein